MPCIKPELTIAVATLVALLSACSAPPVGWSDSDPPPVVVQEPATLQGTVVDSLGEPIADANVTTDPHGYHRVTDDDGQYRVERLPPGTYRVIIAAVGYAPVQVLNTELEAGDEVTVDAQLTAIPTADGLITVQVDGPDGEPMVAAVVSDGMGQDAITDEQGYAVLQGLSLRSVDVSALDADGALWPHTVRDVQVPRLGSAQMSITLSGRPSADAVYVGSDTCAACHGGAASAHGATGHSRALTLGVSDELLALFASGRDVDLTPGVARLQMLDGAPTVTLIPTTGSSVSYQVVGLIGDPRSGSVLWTEIGDQAYPLPVAYRATAPDDAGWPQTLARALPWGRDRWLTVDGALAYTERPNPSESADSLCFACHTTGVDVRRRDDGGADLSASSGADSRWVEAGVGCERCHGPGSSHVNASGATRLYRITRPDRLDQERGADVCASCHSSIEAHDFPFPWSDTAGLHTPGEPLDTFGVSAAALWPSGAARLPGQQADELAQSGHSGDYNMPCWDCHTAHPESDTPHDLRLDSRDNSLCASCHLGSTWAGDQDAMQDHSGHYGYDPAGPTRMGRCVGCHMPATAYRISPQTTSGAGDLSSHLFEALPPSDTLDVFGDDLTLPLGTFPVHACSECHAYGTWLKAQTDQTFGGPHGEPTLRSSHQEHQLAFDRKFP